MESFAHLNIGPDVGIVNNISALYLEDIVKMDQDVETDWPQRLTRLRERAKKSIPDVVRESGISDSTYRSYETEGREPPLSKAAAIAAVLGISLDELAGIEKKPAPDDPERANEALNGQRGLVDPRHMPPEETSKLQTGYFDFGDRVIKASLLLEAYGPPGRLGGYRPDEPGVDE